MEASVRNTELFIERSLPALIHIQMCEGLHIVSGNFQQELKEFEMEKLEQYLKFQKQTKGIPCNLDGFGKCVNRFAKKVFDECFGNLPFCYGKSEEYWPEDFYDGELNLSFKKRLLNNSRDSTIKNRLRDIERELNNTMDTMILKAISRERDMTN